MSAAHMQRKAEEKGDVRVAVLRPWSFRLCRRTDLFLTFFVSLAQQINDEFVAGWDEKKTFKALTAKKEAHLVLRERPFCRTITVQKDSHNHIGFLVRKCFTHMLLGKPALITSTTLPPPPHFPHFLPNISQVKNGEVTTLVKDSSAARNGLLINHRLIEINGQNVVGMPDKDIIAVIQASPRTVTVTVLPTFIYNHLVKK